MYSIAYLTYVFFAKLIYVKQLTYVPLCTDSVHATRPRLMEMVIRRESTRVFVCKNIA